MTYYTLTPADRTGTTAESGRPAVKTILVLRSLPAGVDTTQILIRTDDTRLRVEEGGRWVSPLGEELRGALVDALRHTASSCWIARGITMRLCRGSTLRLEIRRRGRGVLTLAVNWAL